MPWNGCLHIGPVKGLRSVALAFGWLLARGESGQYNDPQANTTALGSVTGPIWKYPFNNIIEVVVVAVVVVVIEVCCITQFHSTLSSLRNLNAKESIMQVFFFIY